jgi:CDP-2,3-bis-(O-geranylgeranyl)-sn-glycerol synthase
MIDIYTFVEALWLVIPAYGANGLASLARGRRPIDSGKYFRGQRIFGDGKTWEGFIFGVVVASAVATFQMFMFPYLPWGLSDVPLQIIPMTPYLGLLLGLGAMVGDLGGSFIKRRMKIQRGRPAPLLDQEDFIIGMFAFAAFVVPIKWEWIIILFILTPAAHLMANGVAYLLKVKKVPY